MASEKEALVSRADQLSTDLESARGKEAALEEQLAKATSAASEMESRVAAAEAGSASEGLRDD